MKECEYIKTIRVFFHICFFTFYIEKTKLTLQISLYKVISNSFFTFTLFDFECATYTASFVHSPHHLFYQHALHLLWFSLFWIKDYYLKKLCRYFLDQSDKYIKKISVNEKFNMVDFFLYFLSSSTFFYWFSETC